LASFAVLEIVVVRRVRPWQFLDPRLAAPHKSPVALRRRRENVIVLRVDALKLDKCFTADKRCVGMKGGHERPAGEVTIHDNLKYVVMAAMFVEVPVIIVGLVKEVKAVETFDPGNFDFDV